MTLGSWPLGSVALGGRTEITADRGELAQRGFAFREIVYRSPIFKETVYRSMTFKAYREV